MSVGRQYGNPYSFWRKSFVKCNHKVTQTRHAVGSIDLHCTSYIPAIMNIRVLFYLVQEPLQRLP